MKRRKGNGKAGKETKRKEKNEKNKRKEGKEQKVKEKIKGLVLENHILCVASLLLLPIHIQPQHDIIGRRDIFSRNEITDRTKSIIAFRGCPW